MNDDYKRDDLTWSSYIQTQNDLISVMQSKISFSTYFTLLSRFWSATNLLHLLPSLQLEQMLVPEKMEKMLLLVVVVVASTVEDMRKMAVEDKGT